MAASRLSSVITNPSANLDPGGSLWLVRWILNAIWDAKTILFKMVFSQPRVLPQDCLDWKTLFQYFLQPLSRFWRWAWGTLEEHSYEIYDEFLTGIIVGRGRLSFRNSPPGNLFESPSFGITFQFWQFPRFGLPPLYHVSHHYAVNVFTSFSFSELGVISGQLQFLGWLFALLAYWISRFC